MLRAVSLSVGQMVMIPFLKSKPESIADNQLQVGGVARFPDTY